MIFWLLYEVLTDCLTFSLKDIGSLTMLCGKPVTVCGFHQKTLHDFWANFIHTFTMMKSKLNLFSCIFAVVALLHFWQIKKTVQCVTLKQVQNFGPMSSFKYKALRITCPSPLCVQVGLGHGEIYRYILYFSKHW